MLVRVTHRHKTVRGTSRRPYTAHQPRQHSQRHGAMYSTKGWSPTGWVSGTGIGPPRVGRQRVGPHAGPYPGGILERERVPEREREGTLERERVPWREREGTLERERGYPSEREGTRERERVRPHGRSLRRTPMAGHDPMAGHCTSPI